MVFKYRDKWYNVAISCKDGVVMQSNILDIILLIPAILVAFTFHEYAHAFMADRLGDKTPRFQGRLTLNPISHIDPIGALLILFTGFGWAKPVQTNPTAYKHYYKDDLKVSLAGPIANLLVALAASLLVAVIVRVIPLITGSSDVLFLIMTNNLAYILFRIVLNIISLNVTLFVLNLIPIPSFDGFHVLRDLFPKVFYKLPTAIYTYSLLIFIILAAPIFGGTSILGFIVGYPSALIFSLLRIIMGI